MKEDPFIDEPQDHYEKHGLWSPEDKEYKPTKLTEELFKKLEQIYKEKELAKS